MAKRKKIVEIPTHEAKTQLSRYLKLVHEGTEVTIKRGTTPVARLVGIRVEAETPKRRPKVGTISSKKVQYSKDCFTPLEGEELEEWGL